MIAKIIAAAILFEALHIFTASLLCILSAEPKPDFKMAYVVSVVVIVAGALITFVLNWCMNTLFL